MSNQAKRSSRRNSSKAGSDQAKSAMLIVGIGASAGGLSALQAFFRHQPSDAGMAFVVVTHMSPEHESHLPLLLQPHTSMPVRQVTDHMEIQPDHVYVIPPNRNLATVDTKFMLEPLEPDRRQRAPIDHFLRTLASTHESNAIGVILSGTGSDGSLGMKQIKEQGGLTVVQEPTQAEYDSMPQSTIATGLVDLVLPVEEIPSRLVEYARTTRQLPPEPKDVDLTDDLRDTVQKILLQVRTRVGHDFSRYKMSTILRRIRHRMQIRGLGNFVDYLELLRGDKEEASALFNDFLITVTNFFRDPAAFQTLEQQVIPKMFLGKGENNQVRVWVIGCASGEEAYSLAILLLEHASHLEERPSVQIFASDLSEAALQRAREAFYPDVIAADVSEERLKRFFVKEKGGYRVRKEVRELVLFAPHNILKDPPFSRLSLISCRNLLIYLERSVQRQVFDLFHYALRHDGYLFLGPSEVYEGTDLFTTVSKRYSIYQRRNTVLQDLRLQGLPFMVPDRTISGESLPVAREQAINYGALHERMVERYAPPTLLVNADYNIVYFSHGVSRYLVQPSGEPTNNVLKRVREELRVELTAALYRAFEKGESSQSLLIPLQDNGQAHRVIVSVWIASEAPSRKSALIVFYEVNRRETVAADKASGDKNDATVRGLEEELELVKKRLQTTIEEFETSKEEMKAANEELQSMNEELRSTAEELETSKEELQSINEELITVNQENKNKVDELSQLSSDLQNLLAATDIATLFLDRELRITRFTPRVSELFNVLATDRGRPLAHITHKLGYTELLDDAAAVLRTLVPVERQAGSEQGQRYLTRILPYRTMDDRIDGLVITFVDITEIELSTTERNRLQTELTAARVLLDAVGSVLPAGLMIVDVPTRRVLLTNSRLTELIGLPSPGDISDLPLLDAEGNLLDGPRHPVTRAAGGERVVDEIVLTHSGGETPRRLCLSATPLPSDDGQITTVLIVVTDQLDA